MMEQSGGRNTACSVCHRVFSKVEHLQRHLRTHTHERPFSCEYCFKSYARKDTLHRHVRRYHFQANDSATPGHGTLEDNEPAEARLPATSEAQADPDPVVVQLTTHTIPNSLMDEGGTVAPWSIDSAFDIDLFNSAITDFINPPDLLASEPFLPDLADRFRNASEQDARHIWFTSAPTAGAFQRSSVSVRTENAATELDETYRMSLHNQLQFQGPNDLLPSVDFLVSSDTPTPFQAFAADSGLESLC